MSKELTKVGSFLCSRKVISSQNKLALCFQPIEMEYLRQAVLNGK